MPGLIHTMHAYAALLEASYAPDSALRSVNVSPTDKDAMQGAPAGPQSLARLGLRVTLLL